MMGGSKAKKKKSGEKFIHSPYAEASNLCVNAKAAPPAATPTRRPTAASDTKVTCFRSSSQPAMKTKMMRHICVMMARASEASTPSKSSAGAATDPSGPDISIEPTDAGF